MGRLPHYDPGMLGVLRPDRPALPADAQAAYGRLYCGLCATLGRTYGSAWRPLHTWDAVFVALLADALVDGALVDDDQPCERVRCPLAPWSHKDVPAPSHRGLQFAAAVQVLALEQRLIDDREEGSVLAVGLLGLTQAGVAVAEHELADLGVALPELRELGAAQTAVEAGRPDVAQAAAPTARAMSAILGAVGELAGAHQDVLRRLGAALGHILYALDALEDLPGDLRAGRFNPCLTGGRISPRRTHATAQLLTEELAALPALIDRLPLGSHAVTARSVLCHALPRRAQEARVRALKLAGPRRSAAERRAGMGALAWGWDRLLVASVTLYIFLGWITGARAAPEGLQGPQVNHFCHEDCCTPSTYCSTGYSHDGRFGFDDCGRRWWQGLGSRIDRADGASGWAAAACPGDTVAYTCGASNCCSGFGCPEQEGGGGCCYHLPGWCEDLCGVIGWVVSLLSAAWEWAEDLVG